jgi:hypothetical protein
LDYIVMLKQAGRGRPAPTHDFTRFFGLFAPISVAIQPRKLISRSNAWYLTDAALARLAIAASRVRRGQRGRWLAGMPPSSIGRASPQIYATAIENLRSGWSEVRQLGGHGRTTLADGGRGSVVARRFIRSRSTARPSI